MKRRLNLERLFVYRAKTDTCLGGLAASMLPLLLDAYSHENQKWSKRLEMPSAEVGAPGPSGSTGTHAARIAEMKCTERPSRKTGFVGFPITLPVVISTSHPPQIR